MNIIYIKKCLGKDGKLIEIHKIRSMELDADQRDDEIVGFDSHEHNLYDPRVTPIGKILRKYWIDEIPQIHCNLNRGDIKLVGIRPKTDYEWRIYSKDLKERALKQKPGLMGVAYAYPRTRIFDEYVNNLNEYLDKWEENPNIADRKYLSRIVQNIIFKGVRSS